MSATTEQFKAARDFLVKNRENYDAGRAGFTWPRFETFNFAIDWFDHLGTDPESKDREALVICDRWLPYKAHLCRAIETLLPISQLAYRNWGQARRSSNAHAQ